MANIKKTKDDALAIINAALTILDRFPEFEETNTNLSFNTSTNPFPFLMDLFKSTMGYNIFLKIISSFIAFALPELELTIKAILLANIKNILTCSLNPFITKDLLLNGVVFDLRELDIINMLSYYPKGNVGQYYYFGCDGMKTADELVKAGDFNAFLWYVKNKSMRRQVWYGVNILSTFEDTAFIDDEEENITVLQKEPKGDPPSKGEIGDDGKLKKCKKSHGIITLQYCERPNSLRNAQGEGATFLQTPHYNCLQVFLGNTQDTVTEITALENDIKDLDVKIADCEVTKNEILSEIEDFHEEIHELDLQLNCQLISYESYKNQIKEIFEDISELRRTLADKEGEIDGLIVKKEGKINTLYGYQSNLDSVNNYRTYKQNYYYKHTLIEFNTDYVMSLKLFDSKTLVTQLIDSLTGCLTVDLNLSYEQLLIKYETQRMVKSVIESDDAVVSDCFFTFTNKDYDDMLKKAELTREGLYAMNVDNPTGAKIDAESILNTLNTINEGSSKETVQSVIEGSLQEISGMISTTEYGEEADQLNSMAKINFIENLMSNLAYVITMSILSPKLYLLLAMNLKIVGQEASFSLNDFIDKNRQMIVEMIRAVRDALIQWLVNKLMDALYDLAKQVAVKLSVEQSKYYVHLLKRLIDCFRSKNNGVDFTIDNVNYADILNEANEPIEEEC